MRIDKELQQQVMDELAWEPSVDAAEIGASVDSGVVMLRGTVRSFPEKWAAERAAKASGVEFAFSGEAPAPVQASLAETGFEKFNATMDAI